MPLIAMTVAFAAEPAPQVVYIWPAGHPTLRGANEKEITNPPQSQPGQVVRQFKNIHNPSLEVFLPPAEKANGADLHIYARGGHAGGIKPRNGIPFGTWAPISGVAGRHRHAQ